MHCIVMYVNNMMFLGAQDSFLGADEENLDLVSKSAGKNFFPAIWFFFPFKKAFHWLPLLEMIEPTVVYV